MKKTFYICTYGGSGSWLLTHSLKKFGNVKHIHSRNPPDKLEYIGKEKGGNTYFEWFNGIAIPEEELKNYCVIYLYRNPSFSIPSRFIWEDHLKHIEVDPTIKINDVLTSGKDLYKIREFYDNYTKPNNNRNYKIYCIKYEDMFDNLDKISNTLGIGKLNIKNRSKRKAHKELEKIYSDLIDEMNKNEVIMIR